MLKDEVPKITADGQAPAPRDLYFMSDYHRVKVPVDDIIYVQSMGEYIKIFRRSDAMPLITLYGIARLAAELPEGQFTRIHRSYIVARSAIEKTSRSEVVLTCGTTLPVSATYKDALTLKA
ncbi:MAG: LytTR family transcriptional regulator [Bacteroidales bacterium]|nr:LytTR family transcriptional regulator [Bacteroidales bacterium]